VLVEAVVAVVVAIMLLPAGVEGTGAVVVAGGSVA